MNERIRIKQIRLVGYEGQQIGLVPIEEGLRLAREAGLDLVEVAPDANPPVCRIMDYTKYRYDQAKKAREAKKRQRQVYVKEIRLRPNIEEHDYQVKRRHGQEFLQKKNKVKFTMLFRGREIAHKELGYKVLNRLIEDLKDTGQTEKPPASEGRNIIMVMAPK